MTKIWYGRRSRAWWGVGTCISSSKWMMGRGVGGTPVGGGIVLRMKGVPVFVGSVSVIGSG